MRRSSITVSPPTTVLARRYGEKLLQNSSENTKPRTPAIIKMIPTVLRLNPEVVTSTAKVKMAPTTNRKMLTPRLNLTASSRTHCPVLCARLLHVRVPPKTRWLSLLLRFSAATAAPRNRDGSAHSTPSGRSGWQHQIRCRQHLPPGLPSAALHLESLVVGSRPPG